MSHAKDVPIERLRLRTKQQNMYFGEIYRNHEHTLKQAQIRPNQPLVAQVLDFDEKLDA